MSNSPIKDKVSYIKDIEDRLGKQEITLEEAKYLLLKPHENTENQDDDWELLNAFE